ncbi:MAG: family ATPase, partial [Frankiales bacterium]|nr:family ATPase [Frankiales bacterium]
EPAAVAARQALTTARELGAAPLVAAVEALAQRGRLAVGGPLRGGPGPFTPREGEVLALVAEGLTNRQVGGRLFISEKTVSVHLSSVMAKLGATSRTEAVAIAGRRGLLRS